MRSALWTIPDISLLACTHDIASAVVIIKPALCFFEYPSIYSDLGADRDTTGM